MKDNLKNYSKSDLRNLIKELEQMIKELVENHETQLKFMSRMIDVTCKKKEELEKDILELRKILNNSNLHLRIKKIE